MLMTIHQLTKKYDSLSQINVLKETYKQVSVIWKSNIDLKDLKEDRFSSIVFCGLGGSAIGGDLVNDYLASEWKNPFLVVRGYNLPAFVNESTLVIISSYSGNTEETISCLKQALKKKSKIIVITSGGMISEVAKKNNLPQLNLQSGFQPRYALGQGFFALLKILQELRLADEDENVEKIVNLWKQKADEYSSENNLALRTANELVGFIPVIYSSEFFASTGYRFKSQLNENSKLHAFHNVIPEMNHNEIIGWESFKEKQFSAKVIYLLDKEFQTQNLKRFEILKGMLTEKKVDVLTLTSNETSKKVRIFDLIFLTDWISFYLSVLRGFDPSEIDFIHRMKQQLT